MPRPPGGAPSAVAFVLWILCLVLVIYPLSIGPVVRILYACGLDDQAEPAGKIFYAPLFLLIEHSDTAKNFIVWYVYELWGTPGPI